jgi:RHS repeat-associated protein
VAVRLCFGPRGVYYFHVIDRFSQGIQKGVMTGGRLKRNAFIVSNKPALEILSPHHRFMGSERTGNRCVSKSGIAQGLNGAKAGVYEYDPFGRALRVTGSAAIENPLRFSTQFSDEIALTLKYLYRDCSQFSGRWSTRDPIDEPGFRTLTRTIRSDNGGDYNIYYFVMNDPIGLFDPLGTDFDATIAKVVGGVFPESWRKSGFPAGDEAGWFAIHCAIHWSLAS